MNSKNLLIFLILSFAPFVSAEHIFTQDTVLKSGDEIVTPSQNDATSWGWLEAKYNTSITITAPNPFVIKAFDSTNSTLEIGAMGILGQGRNILKGDFRFEGISASKDSYGINHIFSFNGLNDIFDFLKKFDTIVTQQFLELDGKFQFDSILSRSGSAYGIRSFSSGVALRQNNHLQINQIQADSGVAAGISSISLINFGTITFDSVVGNKAQGIDTAYLNNSGKIDIKSITSNNGDALGISTLGSLDNSGQIQIGSVSAKQNAVGLYANTLNNDGVITFNQITSKNRAIGFLLEEGIQSQSKGIMTFNSIEGDLEAIGMNISSITDQELTFKSITSNNGIAVGATPFFNDASVIFENISGSRAYGIYAHQAKNIDGSGTTTFKKITGAQESAGIYIDAKGELGESYLDLGQTLHFEEISSKIVISNQGKLSLENSKIIAGVPTASQVQATIYNAMDGGKYYLNDFAINGSFYDYGFFAEKPAEIYVQQGKTATIGGRNSFGGNGIGINLDSAILRLQAGGAIERLSARDSQITFNFSRSSSHRFSINDFQAQNNTFTFDVDTQARSQAGSGAVYLKDGTKSNEGLSSYLHIKGTQANTPLRNKIEINLLSNKNLSEKYILLAQVDSVNQINFNDLQDGGEKDLILKGVSGFKLGRYDDQANSINYYYLYAPVYELFAPPTPIVPPTTPDQPSKPDESPKEFINSLPFNLHQAGIIASIAPMMERMHEMRDDPYTSRLWFKFKGGFWDSKITSSAFKQSDFGLANLQVTIGGDRAFGFLGGKNFLGGAFGINSIATEQIGNLEEMDFYDKFTLSSMGYEGVIYNSLNYDFGFFSNTVLKAGIAIDEVKISDSYKNNPSSAAFVTSIAQELGYKINITPNLFINLSATSSLGYGAGSKFDTSDERGFGTFYLNISQAQSFINQNRADALLGFRMFGNSFIKLLGNVGVGIVNENLIGGKMKYETQKASFESTFKPHHNLLEAQASLGLQIGNRFAAGLNLSSGWGKTYNKTINFGFNLRLDLGSKISSKKIESSIPSPSFNQAF